MDRTLSVLLIEDEEATCEEISQCIATDEGLKLVAITNNSHTAIELVEMHLPNVIILDLELHHGGGNGILFLHQLKQLNLKLPPYILVTTHNMSDVTLEQVRSLGADFTLTKYEAGYNAQYVIDHINLMRPAIHKKNSSNGLESLISPAETERKLTVRIQRELDLIGINPKAVGYKYLTDAILLTINGETANVSRALAPKYGKTEKSIERAMQNAIKQAWVTNDIEDLLKYYTAKVRIDRGSPTLMEFVWYYARKVEMEVKSGKNPHV